MDRNIILQCSERLLVHMEQTRFRRRLGQGMVVSGGRVRRTLGWRARAGARSRAVWTAWCDRENGGERQRELTRGSELRC